MKIRKIRRFYIILVVISVVFSAINIWASIITGSIFDMTIGSDYDIHNQEVYDLKDEYPEQYDLRDVIDIQVENQGEFGLCWDYALSTALETTYNLKYDEQVELSESYIDYMTSNLMNGTRKLHDGGWSYDYYNQVYLH